MRLAAFALGLCLLSLASAGALSTAEAQASTQLQQQVRVILDEFEGPQSARARSLLSESLRHAGYIPISDYDAEEARRNLGLSGSLSDADAVRLAGALRAHAIITGRVSSGRRQFTLTIRVRNGATGESLGTASWNGRNAGVIEGVGRTGAERLTRFLAQAHPPARGAGDTGGGTPPSSGGTLILGPNDAAPAPRPRPRPRPSECDPDDDWCSENGGNTTPPEEGEGEGRGEGEGENGGEPPAAVVEPDPVEPVDLNDDGEISDDELGHFRRYAYPTVGFSLGGGGVLRSMSANLLVYAGQHADGLSTAAAQQVEDQTRSFSPGAGDLAITAELYPGSFGSAPLPYLGLYGHFRQQILLSVETRSPGTDDWNPVSANMYDFELGARGRYRIDDISSGVLLTADLGIGQTGATFAMEDFRSGFRRAVIPSMENLYLGIGLGFLAPVGRSFSLGLSAGARIGLANAQTTRDVWGDLSPPANGFVARLDTRADLSMLTRGCYLQILGEWAAYVSSFDGRSTYDATLSTTPWDGSIANSGFEPLIAMPTGSDGNASATGVEGVVVDHYLRLHVMLGFQFR